MVDLNGFEKPYIVREIVDGKVLQPIYYPVASIEECREIIRRARKASEERNRQRAIEHETPEYQEYRRQVITQFGYDPCAFDRPVRYLICRIQHELIEEVE